MENPGHKEAYCWQKQKDEANQASFAEKTEDSKLFMAVFSGDEKCKDVWFLDSGWSKHMSGTRSLFRELDESKKSELTLGDNQKIQVHGKGTSSVTTSKGNTKVLDDVLLVPSFSHNLLSVRQLMISGYSLLFDDGYCVIRDKASGLITANDC